MTVDYEILLHVVSTSSIPSSAFTLLSCQVLASVSEGDVLSKRDDWPNRRESKLSFIAWLNACDVPWNQTWKQLLVHAAPVSDASKDTKYLRVSYSVYISGQWQRAENSWIGQAATPA
jgi:hypothetical protein